MSAVARNPLEEAEGLYRRRRWADLINLLEPLTSVYRDNARFSVLLGAAYLHKEDVGGAWSCFRRAQSLDYRDPDAAYGLAAVSIRRGETDRAVQLYVEMLERRPRDRKARFGLDLVRTTKNHERAASSRRLRRLYPQPPRRLGGLMIAALCVVVVIGAVRGGPVLLDMMRNARPGRAGVSAVVLSPEEAAGPVGSEGGFEIVLTEKEAVATFDRAKRLFAEYRDEAALVELNRLLLSNATRQVKAKAQMLATYVREPSFLSMPDRYSYADVAANPQLYEGVGVVWKGLPANVVGSTTSATFDLLVGYHDKRKLEGIVQVQAAFALDLTPEGAIEVLARVKSSGGKKFYLECLAVHEL
ncbi:MAG TPA: hypothetical protein VMX33_02190 [bacterium]|nr:hypothetical protein [bacterium]